MQGAHVTLGKGPADRIGGTEGREGWIEGREAKVFCFVWFGIRHYLYWTGRS